MPTEHIVTLLIAERDKLTRAIEVLQGTRRRGRPPKDPLAVPEAGATAPEPTKRGQRTFTSAQRKAQGQRMKAYWAAKKQPAK